MKALSGESDNFFKVKLFFKKPENTETYHDAA